MLAVAGMLVGVGPLAGQNPSNAPNVTLAAVKAETLTLTINSGAAVDFDLDAGTVAAGDVAVNVTLDWSVQGNRTDLELWGAFSSAADALTDGFGNSIPSSAVEGALNGGGFSPFTATSTGSFLGAAGAALMLYTVDPSGGNHTGTRTDDVTLQIDQTGLTLPAGTFSGTLTLQATAF
jgi:hypothetical protein